ARCFAAWAASRTRRKCSGACCAMPSGCPRTTATRSAPGWTWRATTCRRPRMNPYAPPGAAVGDLPAKPGSAVKAVVLGFLVDIGGTLVGTIVLGIVYGIVLAASGASEEELIAA